MIHSEFIQNDCVNTEKNNKKVYPMNYFEMSILARAEDYVCDLLKSRLDKKFCFHSFYHTSQVVAKVTELAKIEKLSIEETRVVMLAAWFQDIGYVYDINSHEECSCAIASEFLLRYNTEEDAIEKVCMTILSTRSPQKPQNKLEEILCDSDMHHLGSTNYDFWNMLLRKEIELTGTSRISDNEWLNQTVRIFENHHYFTPYAIKQWGEQKAKNILQAVH